jgi:branched-subunit amino acid aminotransferase/4-amino-4-deoxychorismate lyase
MSVWFDGRLVDRAAVSVLDPAVQIGFGLFEVMRAYDGAPYLLDRHLARMRRSARRFGLRVRWSDAAIKRGANKLLRKLKLPSAYVRLVLTAGGSFMIQAKPLPRLPSAWHRTGAAVEFAPWRRDPRAPLYGHKTLNYLENVLTLERARKKGLADYLFLSVDGRVMEGCVTNVFLVRKGVLMTPDLEGILPGVTRDEVIRLARALRIPVKERRLTPRDFERADEAFLTNALIEVLPVSKVASRRIGSPGPITSRLRDAYRPPDLP